MSATDTATISAPRPRTTHELKLWPEYFEQVRNGRMSFQLRRNDRGFKVGDELLLKEWIPDGYLPVMPVSKNYVVGEAPSPGYTGRELLVRVDFIMDDLHRFIKDPEDYVIMSISHVN